jgi:TMEM175 potassium channel family protein
LHACNRARRKWRRSGRGAVSRHSSESVRFTTFRPTTDRDRSTAGATYGTGVAGRERDLDRLLTFVDAVVAIAITLLVLPLVDVAREIRTDDVADLLREHSDDLAGFLLSFVVIARLWLAQHAILGPVVRQNAAVLWLLLAWTLTIVFLPFPTALVTATQNDSLAKVLYIGTMAVSSALLALVARAVRRDRGIRDTDTGPDAAQATCTAVAFLLALGISLTFPAISYWPLLILFLVDPAVRLLRAKGVLRPLVGS